MAHTLLSIYSLTKSKFCSKFYKLVITTTVQTVVWRALKCQYQDRRDIHNWGKRYQQGISIIKVMIKNPPNGKHWISRHMVFYKLYHSSLVNPVLSLFIPGLSLAILGLSLLVPSQIQDVHDSSCLMFYQQYINGWNKLNLLSTMVWYIF